MNFLWLIIPVLVAFPLFFLTMSVSIIASRVHPKSHEIVFPENADNK